MKVLLAGGNSTLANALRPAMSPFAEVLTAGRAGCDVELDLAWPADRFVLPEGLDTVIHLGAHFGGNDFEAMEAAETVNVLGALKLAQACHGAGVGHLVQISSIFAGLNENAPFFNVYALSKRHAEELTALYCRNAGLPLAIIRPAQLYGEGEAFRRHQPFIYALMDRAQRGEDITLFGSNDAQRNFIHIEDVAEVIARVVRQRIEGRYTCASPANVRFSEIAAAAVAAFGSASAIRFDADKPDVADNGFAADDTLYRLVDYAPRISIEQGLAREAARRMAEA
jgi:nucleoside-diphosphate-sugar epimerase